MSQYPTGMCAIGPVSCRGCHHPKSGGINGQNLHNNDDKSEPYFHSVPYTYRIS